MKKNTKSKSSGVETPIAPPKKLAPKASTNSIKVKGVEDALAHFRRSFGHGEEHLKHQKDRLTEADYKILVLGVEKGIALEFKKSRFSPNLDAVMETFRSSMQRIAETMRVSMKLPVIDLKLNLPSIDLESLERTLVEVDAYSALAGYLEKAISDPQVRKSAPMLSIAELMLKTVADSDVGGGAERLLEQLGRAAIVDAISKRTSEAASKKNLAPREWVINEWKNRTNKSEKKSVFADRHSAMLENGVTINGTKIEVKVTAKTIETRWLPKEK